eukprot:scaffold21960_cov180-Skeletonema_marinoi.AAC.2
MHEIHEQGLIGSPPADVEKGLLKHCVMTLTRMRKEAKHSVLLMIWRDQISYTQGFTKMCNIWRAGGGKQSPEERLITSCEMARKITL